ncbi:MAG: HPP family protein [Erythrobacter sp.]|nr:MAG: HPP family protein [Erythrobacter sp.]
MFQAFLDRSATLLPQAALGHIGWLRGAVGATIAIGCSALLTRLLLGQNSADLPWLVAPLGASAVLVFAVPASPLAQPWPVIGGNLLSALIGLGLGAYLGSPWLAASLAVGLAIACMSLARCLHPPGGASALLCALGASGPEMWSWPHLVPIATNVVMLAVAGWAYNNATGHHWPHRAGPALLEPVTPAGNHTREDIEHLLREWDEVLDVDVDDLDAFYRELNRRISLRSRS